MMTRSSQFSLQSFPLLKINPVHFLIFENSFIRKSGSIKMFLNEYENTRVGKIDQIKALLDKGLFEFVNGGISQADEACTSYEDIIANYF